MSVIEKALQKAPPILLYEDWQVEVAAKELELKPPIQPDELHIVMRLLNGVKIASPTEFESRSNIVFAPKLAEEGRYYEDRDLSLHGLLRHVQKTCAPVETVTDSVVRA